MYKSGKYYSKLGIPEGSAFPTATYVGDGDLFYRTDLDTAYIRAGGVWIDIMASGGGGASAFTGLTDTPADYTGYAEYTVTVKGDESGLDYTLLGSGVGTFLGLTDTPTTFSGYAGYYLKVNTGETALEYGQPGGGVDWENILIVAKSGGDYTSVVTAHAAAVAGDTILVMPGTYTETSAITWTNGVNLVGYDWLNTEVIWTHASATAAITIGSGVTAEIRSLKLKKEYVGFSERVIETATGGVLWLIDCYIHNLGYGTSYPLYFIGGEAHVINCWCYDLGAASIALYVTGASTVVKVRRSWIQALYQSNGTLTLDNVGFGTGSFTFAGGTHSFEDADYSQAVAASQDIKTNYGFVAGDDTINPPTGSLISELKLGAYVALDLRATGRVAHGMVNEFGQTSAYSVMHKISSTTGGLSIRGGKESGGSADALVMEGFYANDMTVTPATTARAPVEAHGYQCAAARENAIANGLVFGVRTYRGGAEASLMFIDEDGDLHLDAGGGTGGTAAGFVYDEYDDVALLHGLKASIVPDEHEFKEKFGEWIDYARPILEEAGIVHYNDGPGEDGRPFVSIRGVQYLTIDAVRQLYQRMEQYENLLADLGADIKLLTDGKGD